MSILKTALPDSGRCAKILLATLMKLKSPYAQWQDRVMAMNALKYHIDFSQLDSSQDHRAYNSFVRKFPTEMRNGKKKTYLKRAACPTSIQGRSSVSFNILPQFSLIEHNSNICPTESISPPTLQNSINQISSTFQDLSSGEFSVTFVSGGTLFRISHRRICRRDTSCLLGGARHDAYPLSAPSVEVYIHILLSLH